MHAKRILVLNILFETHFKASFDNRMAEALTPLGVPYDTIYLDELQAFSRFDDYTHLLISGSTDCAGEDNEWTPHLEAIIQQFRSLGKSILGICYGHQFLARAIQGKDAVRKSATPEIGWTTLTVSGNPIFKNIDSLKAAVFHYDEVTGLDERFEITASSERCAVHGFQVKGEPSWGVQFHPDFLYHDVFEFADETKKNNPRFDEIHCGVSTTQEEFRACDQLFSNWLEIS